MIRDLSKFLKFVGWVVKNIQERNLSEEEIDDYCWDIENEIIELLKKYPKLKEEE